METLNEKQRIKRIITLINDRVGNAVVEDNFNLKKQGFKIDLILKTEAYIFVVKFKSSGAVSLVSGAIEQLKQFTANTNKNIVPLVAVPFMGEVGHQLCVRENISWIDLSGNAHIAAPGLKIHIEGKPNLFKSAGRPKDIFAPKSSRLTRHLLIEPQRFITQRELAVETQSDEGLVSRVVRALEQNNLLVRNRAGAVKPKNPEILLAAWSERYSFSKHHLIKGFIAERSSSEILPKLIGQLNREKLIYTVTGLSAAWQLTHFATYRTTTVYLSEEPDDDFFKKIKFNPGERGSNVWLVIPNDTGVFDGSSVYQEIRCAHPVQIYLDLSEHPERAKEAALQLKKEFLNWEAYVN